MVETVGFLELLRTALGAYLIFTGAMKMVGRRVFYLALLAYGLRRNFAIAISFLAPFFETVIGFFLFFEKFVFPASILAATGACFYAGLVAKALAKKNRLENCGCYGALKVPLGWWNLAEDLSVISIALAIALSSQPL